MPKVVDTSWACIRSNGFSYQTSGTHVFSMVADGWHNVPRRMRRGLWRFARSCWKCRRQFRWLLRIAESTAIPATLWNSWRKRHLLDGGPGAYLSPSGLCWRRLASHGWHWQCNVKQDWQAGHCETGTSSSSSAVRRRMNDGPCPRACR